MSINQFEWSNKWSEKERRRRRRRWMRSIFDDVRHGVCALPQPMMTKFPVPQSTEQGTKIDWHGCVRWQKKRGRRLWLWKSQKSMFVARFTNFRFFVYSIAVVFRFPRLSNSSTNIFSFNRSTDLICVVPVCLLRLSSAIQCSAHRDRPRPRSGELCATSHKE